MIDGEHIKVKIHQQTACLSCKVAKHCNASGSKEKIIDVDLNDSFKVSKGEKVIITASGENGFLAVLLSSIVPLIVLLVVLAASMIITKDEAFSGLACLIALVPYYLILYLFRNKIREKFSFQIEPYEENFEENITLHQDNY